MSGADEKRASLQVLTPDERRAAVATARAVSDIREARERQVHEKGYSPAHDDQYGLGELWAAATYAVSGAGLPPAGARFGKQMWPWAWRFFKPRSHRENLVRAGALIVAAIEKIDRAEVRS